MRSRFQLLEAHHPSEVSLLLERAECLAAGLSAGKILDAIGRTARLDAVLRARHAALLASTRPEPLQPAPEINRYLDAAKTARYLNVSRSTVARLTKAGALPCIHPSDGSVRYDRQDLDSFMNARKRGVSTSVLLPP
jgi:excisionase family DNA binding protein